MGSRIDPTLPVNGALIFAEDVQQLATDAKDDIEELQGAQVTSGSGTGMVFSRRGRVRFPDKGDGVTDLATDTTNFWTSLQGTGRILKYDAGEYLNSAVYPALSGFYIETEGADTILTSTRKTNTQVNLTGNACGIEGGIWQSRPGRQYDITAATANGATCTCTIPGHTFEIGDSVRIRAAVGININGTKTVTGAVAGTSITFSSTENGSATIPYSRPDLWNTGSRAITPHAQLDRLGDDVSNIIKVSGMTAGHQWHVRDLMVRGFRQNGLQVYSPFGEIKNIECWEGAADGISFVSSAHTIRMPGVTKVRRVEEAQLSFIGYRKMAGYQANVRIETLDLGDQYAHGTGLDVLGVKGLSIDRLIVTNVYGSGIRIIGDASVFYTFGPYDVRIGHATFNSCGVRGADVPAGWENTDYPTVLVGGTSGEEQKVKHVRIDELEIFNSRWRPFNDSGPSQLSIGRLHVHGGINGPTALLDPYDWHVEKAVFEETPESPLTLGDATASGVNRWDDIELRNINNGGPIGFASGACDGTTVTLVTDSAHGLSGTPVFRSLGFESATTDVSGSVAKAAQDKDFALNGNWMPMPSAWVSGTNYAQWARVIPTAGAGGGYYFEAVVDSGSAGSTEPTWPTADGAIVVDGGITWIARALANVNTYTGISFPDSVTIAMTGTGKVATSSPRVYSVTARIPKAYLVKGGTATNDGIGVDNGVAGTPQGAFVIGNVELKEQFFALDRLVSVGTPGALRLKGARDWTARTTGLLNVSVEAETGIIGTVPGFNRYTSNYVGVPFAAAIAGDTIYAIRIYIERPEAIITRMGFTVTTAETGADARMGLYAPDGALLATGEYADAFTGTGDREITCYHRIWRPGWYILALNTNRASTGAINWHYIDTATEARLRSGAAASTTDLGFTAAELAAAIGAAADFAGLQTALAARTPSPDFRLTQALTYGAMPATLTLARSNGVTEPHLWVRYA